ncbi:MAG: RIP metalloprotease RseP [Eubacteriales bacterium]|nr:RIP metalloprotease RseP [Eubacteriales bacterium]
MTIIYAILIFCVLIFVHEAGHFIAAKLCGVKVNEFALGMGPALIKKQKEETLYSLRAFPIGGFCAMEGEDEEYGDPRAFNNKKAWQKSIILIAGSLMNLILAVAILAGVALYMGTPVPVVSEFMEGSPAQKAGIEIGDTVAAVDGQKVYEWEDLNRLIGESTGETLAVTVVGKSGAEKTVITNVLVDETGRRLIGFIPERSHNVMAATIDGVKATGNMTVSMVDILRQLFTGDVPVSDLSGPVGIVAIVNDTAPMGFVYIAYIAALISLNLAIINMLPFPALDGGRLVFIAIRKVTGKAITDEIEARVHFAGIMLLFGLMIYVTWNDILKFVVPLFT